MIENKYKKWYDKLVNFRKTNILESNYEIHHILPKSLGGINEADNLVRLTYREHYIAHLLLTKFVDTTEAYVKMCWAMHRLAFSHKGAFSSREYETARRIHINNLIENHHSKRIPKWSEFLSENRLDYYKTNRSLAQREAISKAQKKNWAENYDKMKEIAIKNLKNDGSRTGKNNPGTITIEYLGQTYYGWQQLKEMTGISSHNYKSNYKGNNDISNRIGRDGPKAIEIEYNGQYYYGWNELKRKTGVSKHMYINHYGKESQ